eukprot:3976178-Prymnesium_polylepis.1
MQEENDNGIFPRVVRDGIRMFELPPRNDCPKPPPVSTLLGDTSKLRARRGAWLELAMTTPAPRRGRPKGSKTRRGSGWT